MSPVFFTIEQQTTGSALRQLANQSNIQLLFTPNVVKDQQSPAITGVYTAKQALTILLKGTGLSYKFTDKNTVVITKAEVAISPSPTIKEQAEPAPSKNQRTVLEEIIVSSQHRNEKLQDVPLAVTVFTREKIKNWQLKDSRGVTPSSPNLQWKSIGAATGGNIFLRGIGDNSFQLNQVGAVGIHVDGVVLNSPSVNIFSLLDLERIEVIRGPQNTLYGRNTPGGAINYISRKPSLDQDFNAHFSLTAGRYNEQGLQTGIGFKINDKAAARIAFQSLRRDGIYYNPTLNRDETDTDNQSARMMLLVKPEEETEFLLSLHGGKKRGENRRWKQIGLLDPSTGTPCAPSLAKRLGSGCTDIYGFADTDDTDKVFSGDPNPRENLDAWGGSLRMNHAYSGVTLSSISAYESNRLRRNEDTDSSPLPIFSFYQQAKVEQFSEELRLTSNNDSTMEWMTGLFLFSENLYASTATATPLIVDPINGSTGGATVLHQDNDAWSIYGQTSFELTPKAALTLGLRYTDETKKGDIELLQFASETIPVGTFINESIFKAQQVEAIAPHNFDEQWQEWGGRIAIDYQFNHSAMLYGSIARGFKGGGVNIGTRQFDSEFAHQRIDPELLLTYEIGLKSTWLDDSLTLNIAAFHNKFDEQQVFQVVNGDPVLTNAAESRINGLEIELNWLPAPGWVINGSVGLLDAKFKTFDTGDGNDHSGNQLIVAPDYNAHLSIRKEWQLNSHLIGVQAEISRVDEQYYAVDNHPASLESAHNLVNFSGFFHFGEQNQHQATAWVNNVFDEVYCTDRIDLRDQGLYQCSLNQPLTYGLTISTEI